MSRNIIFLSSLLFILIIGIFYWMQIRPSQIKAQCNSEVYKPRVNEDNFEWAKDKRWMPRPGHAVTDPESYVWIYPDKSDTTWEGENAHRKREVDQNKSFYLCLQREGL